MIRVFIADDHKIVCDGLQRLLHETPGVVFVGSASRGHQVLQLAEKNTWDVLLLDLSFEDISGVEVLRRLRVSHPDLAIIVLSMYPEEQYAVRLIKMGASAYLSKGRSSDELVAAIHAVARGGGHISRTPSVKRSSPRAA